MCRSRGSARLGYPCIVGAGAHATILHYIENDGEVADGDLVLVDAGCEVDYYTADITRTWPASGTVHGAAARALRDRARGAARGDRRVPPGRTMQEVHDVAVRVLVDGMLARRAPARRAPADLIADQKHARYYMHKTSHWLGLDVHDVGRYVRKSGRVPLEPGLVLTVEPGLYVPRRRRPRRRRSSAASGSGSRTTSS